MAEHRTKPGVGFYLACFAAASVLYFLSLAPAIWICSSMYSHHPWMETAYRAYLLPAQFVHDHSPAVVRDALDAYADLFDR